MLHGLRYYRNPAQALELERDTFLRISQSGEWAVSEKAVAINFHLVFVYLQLLCTGVAPMFGHREEFLCLELHVLDSKASSPLHFSLAEAEAFLCGYRFHVCKINIHPEAPGACGSACSRGIECCNGEKPLQRLERTARERCHRIPAFASSCCHHLSLSLGFKTTALKSLHWNRKVYSSLSPALTQSYSTIKVYTCHRQSLGNSTVPCWLIIHISLDNQQMNVSTSTTEKHRIWGCFWHCKMFVYGVWSVTVISYICEDCRHQVMNAHRCEDTFTFGCFLSILQIGACFNRVLVCNMA